MPPVLRKRKAPVVEPTAAPPTKKKGPVAKAAKKTAAADPETATDKGASSTGNATVGGKVDLKGFGGEVETNDGKKVTLKELVDASEGGVVLFTYPKASTPGCTTQACKFRDAYTDVTTTGFAIYGLSRDSTKANTTFKEKQKLPYPLLCDPSGTLISAIGLKKFPSGTTRGVFVVDKSGAVLAAHAGSPGGTVAVVKKLVENGTGSPSESKGGPVDRDGSPSSEKGSASPAGSAA